VIGREFALQQANIQNLNVRVSKIRLINQESKKKKKRRSEEKKNPNCVFGPNLVDNKEILKLCDAVSVLGHQSSKCQRIRFRARAAEKVEEQVLDLVTDSQAKLVVLVHTACR
jgi:hypothetical protein